MGVFYQPSVARHVLDCSLFTYYDRDQEFTARVTGVYAAGMDPGLRAAHAAGYMPNGRFCIQSWLAIDQHISGFLAS